MTAAAIDTRPGSRTLRSVAVVLLVVACAVLAVASSARAVSPAVGWVLDSRAIPSSFSAADNTECLRGINGGYNDPAHCDSYQVLAREAGSVSSDGSTITMTGSLPAGLTVQKIVFTWSGFPGEPRFNLALVPGICTTVPLRCQFSTSEFGLPPVAPDDRMEMSVYVTVQGAPGPLVYPAAVSGGGAPEVSTGVHNQIDETPSLFGFAAFSAPISGVDGLPDTQAGDHPWEYATRIDLNNQSRPGPEDADPPVFTSIHDPKDVMIDLPLGFLGSALAAPQCSVTQLSSQASCPANTVLGFIRTEPVNTFSAVASPLYNLVPEQGVAAEFGFHDGLKGAHILASGVASTPAGYVLRSISRDIPQVAISAIEVTLYGNPAVRDASGNAPVALFTNPASCSAQPLVTGIHMDSWQNPGRFNPDGSPDLGDPAWVSATSQSPPVTGCDLLRFEPSLRSQPETKTADSPTGLEVEMKIPQNETPGTLATPPLRDATVTLPAGLTVNPSAATGLGACSEAQVGLGSAAQPACPESSKIGTLEVTTPLVGGTLPGSIYLATQNENPFHTLLAGYLVIDDPTTGTLIKVPGSLTPDPSTGQITGSFRESPQFPFSDLKLHFFGGPRGELSTPQTCGTYTTTSDLMPWSAPDSGPDATPSDSFPIDTGCVTGFNPAFTAGSTNPQAGTYSPFTVSFSRTDAEQNLAGLSVRLPPGLLGKIAGIPLCPDANANAGNCPEASQVGSVTVGAGVGPNPLFVGGKAYLTGPYNGGPYGLVVQVPAVAGPFNLGMVSVRQSLRIDPHTAQVTAVSDPFPTILDGIPLRVRRVDLTVDRPEFTFNPTNCNTMAITGNVTSTQGASSSISSRFQAGGCRELPFKPSFKVSTQAKTSKKQGTSLDVKVTSSQGQANIGKVAVSLPKQLPSRLTTIQQACTEQAFNANPASCPAGSNIGIATAHTPVLPDPVVGPAYLVSHGGAAFPDLVVILQGDGVRLELVGSIDIKHGVTSSAFDSVPDAPISSFELSLPEGPHSALAAVLPAKAKGNLCGTSLVMPTTITGQNGAQIKQSTKITVTGCPKARKAKKHKANPTQRAHGKHGKKR
jgi:hypothetical protein